MSLREQREQVVRRHIAAENSGDLDAMIASFHRAVVPPSCLRGRRMTGTHRGEWAGLTPHGRRMDIQLACVFDFEGELLVNETVYFDFATLQRQLGAA